MSGSHTASTITSTTSQDAFIDERLEALHSVDAKLVSILNHASSALANLTSLKQNASNDEKLTQIKNEFESDIKNFYTDLEFASSTLKKEIRTLDDRIGKTDSNGVTMLPISINKKATWVGKEKMKSQLDALDTLLKEAD